MNKIFKIIWSTSKQAYVVVSEFANVSGGKKKLAAAVLAFVMGLSAGTSAVSAWSRSEENLMAEVMKRIDAKYVKDGRNITIGQETESGLNSITIGRMARAAYSRPGNDGWENKKVTYTLGGENKNAVAIGTNSLAGAANIASIIPANETTYFNYSSIANLPSQVVYYRTQMTKIKDPNQKGISERYYGEGDIKIAAKGDGNLKLYDVVRDSGTDQVAIGHHSRAIGDQAISIGSNSMAGRYSIVMGGNSFGDKNDKESFYKMYLDNGGIFRTLSGYRWIDSNPKNEVEGSTYAGEASVAIGTKAHAMTPLGTAVGAMARIEQNSLGAVALGAGSSVGSRNAGHDSIGAVAIGMGSAAKGIGTIALGARAMIWPKAGGVNRITAIGYGTVANNEDSVALGSLAEADRGSDMAGYFYGYKAATIDKSKEAGSIELKLKDGAADLIENYEVKVTPSAWEVPKATETDIEKGFRTHVYEGLKGPALKANAGALSIGKNGSTPNAADAITRQIVNVAAGTNDTDAVNVAQLRNVNMMIEADSAGAGTPKAFSDFLLDNSRLKISGQSYLSTELTQDKEGPRITLKAKTTELVSNQDGTYTTKNNEDGLITAGELVKRMNAAKKERDNLEKKIGELVYLNDKGEKLQQKDGKFFKVKPDGSLDESKEETPAAITSKRPGLQLANVNGAVTQLTPDGLADLSNIPKTTGVNVDDISKIGWILSVPKDNYSEAVIHNRKVSFFGNDLAKVTGSGKGEDPRMITVTVDRKETGKAVEQEFLNNGFTQIRYVDADNKPLVRDADGKYYYPVSDTDNTPNKNKGAVEPAARMADVDSHPTVLTNVKHGADVIKKPGDPTDGLADLSKASQRGNVATVEDLHNLGFVIKGKADDDSDVNGQVKHANTVEFAGEDLAHVVVTSADGKHKVTVKVNKDDVAQAVNAANAKKGATPTTYVDKDGNPLVKDDDGNYYKVKDDGTPDKDAGTADPAGVRLGEKDTPIQLTNVKPGTNEITAEGPTKGLADLEHAVPGTVATVDDLKKMGFVVADGANYHDTVANAQTVKFVGEGLATVTGETKDNIRTFTVKVDKEEVAKAINAEGAKKGTAPTTYVDKDGNPLVKGDDGKYYKAKADGTPDKDAGEQKPAGVRLGEKDTPIQLTNVAPATKAIDKENDPTKGLADLAKANDGTVATVADLKKLGFVVADGGNYHATVTNAQTVKFVGEGLATVTGETKDDIRTFTVKVDDKKVADAVKSINDKAGNAPTQYVDKDGNPLVKAKDGKYYPKDKVGDDGTPKPDAQAVDPAGIQVGEKDKPTQLTNVAPATKAIDKPNDPTNGLADLANAKDGTVATVDDLRKLGFVIKGKAADGTTDVTGQVKHASTVEFAGEDLAKVITESANGVSKVTVKVNKEEIAKAVNAENAKKGSAPTTYVDENGNPVVKAKDGKYYPTDKVGDDGTPQTGAQAVDSPVIQVGEKDKPMQLDNVARGTETKPVNGKDGQPITGSDNQPLQLVDLKDAKNTKVATVGDLKDMGFVLGASVNAVGGDKAYHDVVKNGNKVRFEGLGGAWISGKTDQDGTRVITIDVNADNLVTGTQNAVQYVDGEGNRMIPILQTGNEVLYYNAADNPVKHKMPNSDKEAIYKMSDIAEDGTLKPGAKPLDGKKAGDVPNLGVALVHPNGSANTKEGTVLRNVGEGTATIGAPQNADDKVGKAKEGLADLDKSKDTNGLSVADAKKLGFVIKGKAADGTTDVTGQVKHANTVEFAGEDLAKVITESKDGNHKVTVKVDKNDVAQAVNAVNAKKGTTPTTYVDRDGNPLVKGDDGNYYKVKDDGTLDKDGGAVDPVGVRLGEKDKPIQLTNVAPATKEITTDGPTKGLADLANDGTVATVADLKKLGFVIKGTDGNGKPVSGQVKHANTVEFAGEDLAKVITESANGVSKVTVKVNKEDIVKVVNDANDKKGSAPTQYVDKDGNPLVKAKDGKYYPKDKVGEDGNPQTGVQPVEPAGIQVGEKGKTTQLTNVAPATEAINNPNDPTNGLANLAKANDGTVATVADLKKLGFVVADGADYHATVTNAQTVKFVGEGLAEVTGETKDNVRTFTVKVDDKKVADAVKAINDKAGNAPTQYVDKDGNPLVKAKDGKYYPKDKVGDDGTPQTGAQAVEPAGIQVGEKGKTTQLTNVAPATEAINNPNDPTNGLANLAKANDGTVATVADLKKLGFVIKGKAADGTTDVTGQVKHANTVEFAGEDLAKVITESANGESKVTVKVNKEDIVKVVNDANDKKGSAPTQYVDKDGNPLVKAKDGKYYPKDKVGDDGTPQTGAQAVDPVGIQVGEKDKPTRLMNIAPGTTSIAMPTDPNASPVDKAKGGLADLSIPTDAAAANVSKHTAATVDDLRRMGWILSVGDTYADKVQNAQEVNFKGAGLAEVSGQTEGQKRVITVTVDEQKVAAAVKAINDKAGNTPIQYVDDKGNPLVKVGDKYYTKDQLKDDGQPKPDEKEAKNVVIQVGDKNKPKQLTNVAAGTSEIKEGPTKGLADLEHATSGTVATVDDLQKLGFVIKGKAADGTTDVVAQVRHANTVEFAGDGLAKVITESKDGVSKVTVKVNKEEIAKAVNAENAKNGSAPIQYVDKDGNSLVKDGDKYYKAKDDGTPDTDAGEKTPAGVQIGEKDKPITVTNVKSNFAAVAPDAKEAKAPESKKNPDGSVDPTAANPLVAMQHNAATIADIMNSPWNLQVNGKAVKAVKSFDTVNITDGTNTKVVATETGYKVNVVGLPTAYTDNAGHTIAKGADGKWFVTDKDGNMTATPADLGQDGKGTPSVSLVNPAAEPGKAGEPVVMHNVGKGNAPTDAVNKEQMDEAFAKLGNSVAGVQSEMRNVGADAAALAALKPLQYDPLEPTQIMAGVGLYKNNNAVALGIAHYTNESTLFHAGISFGGSQNMINLGITKKFGHHDKKENQVQDRYRSGPISSVYIMQDEVEALKAENREQKKEIEELKAMVMQLMNKQK